MFKQITGWPHSAVETQGFPEEFCAVHKSLICRTGHNVCTSPGGGNRILSIDSVLPAPHLHHPKQNHLKKMNGKWNFSFINKFSINDLYFLFSVQYYINLCVLWYHDPYSLLLMMMMMIFVTIILIIIAICITVSHWSRSVNILHSAA